MALSVLQGMDEFHAARAEMQRRGASSATPLWLAKLLRAICLGGWVRFDVRKSWDVWKTVRFLEDHVAKDDPIVDLGAHQSEVVSALHKVGFRKLSGIDLNPKVVREPFHEVVDYRVGDFHDAPFAPGTFAAVTSISAIEHGYDPERLLPAVSRLLRPGGYFLCSTDYWPTKIDTRGQLIYGLSWTIFSEAEIADLFARAERHGLEAVGAFDGSASTPTIRFLGRDYTFAWLALRKRT